MSGRGALEAKLLSMGLVLPPVPAPVGQFRHGRMEGSLLFLSGQGPVLETGLLATGKVGADIATAEARHHAMRTGLVLLAAAKSILGELDRIKAVVKLLGFVNSTPDYDSHARVIDGCSELFQAVFGERGVHARSAIGVQSLPGGISVEIEAILAVASEG
jgi:enamine deaminase RidA (YjgF/YER057c/UK114 family)